MTEAVRVVGGVSLYTISDDFSQDPPSVAVTKPPKLVATGAKERQFEKVKEAMDDASSASQHKKWSGVRYRRWSRRNGFAALCYQDQNVTEPAIPRHPLRLDPGLLMDVAHRVVTDFSMPRLPRRKQGGVVLATYLAASTDRSARSARRHATVSTLHEHLVSVLQARLDELSDEERLRVTSLMLHDEASTALRSLAGRVLERIDEALESLPVNDRRDRQVVPVEIPDGLPVTFLLEAHRSNRAGRRRQLHVSSARIGSRIG